MPAGPDKQCSSPVLHLSPSAAHRADLLGPATGRPVNAAAKTLRFAGTGHQPALPEPAQTGPKDLIQERGKGPGGPPVDHTRRPVSLTVASNRPTRSPTPDWHRGGQQRPPHADRRGRRSPTSHRTSRTGSVRSSAVQHIPQPVGHLGRAPRDGRQRRKPPRRRRAVHLHEQWIDQGPVPRLARGILRPESCDQLGGAHAPWGHWGVRVRRSSTRTATASR
jgi:hypothetical protein